MMRIRIHDPILRNFIWRFLYWPGHSGASWCRRTQTTSRLRYCSNASALVARRRPSRPPVVGAVPMRPRTAA